MTRATRLLVALGAPPSATTYTAIVPRHGLDASNMLGLPSRARGTVTIGWGCGDTSRAAPTASMSASATGAAPESHVDFLEGACRRGNDVACEKLMEAHLEGQGTPVDRGRSAALAGELCEGGRRRFCPTFALVLHEGDGVPRDPERARQLYLDTCDDDPVACSEYGSLYNAGHGLRRTR